MRSLSRLSQLLLKKKGACGPQVPDPTPSNWCRWQQAGQGPRDSTAWPTALQEPDKNPLLSEIRRGRSVKHSPAKSSDLGPGFAWWSVKREAFASTKAFDRVGFSRHKLCLGVFLFHDTARHGTVSLPLRDVAGIRMSDDKSLGGNVRKWGFLRWKCSPCTLYLLQIEAAEGGIQPRRIYQRCPKRLISVWSGKGVQR